MVTTEGDRVVGAGAGEGARVDAGGIEGISSDDVEASVGSGEAAVEGSGVGRGVGGELAGAGVGGEEAGAGVGGGGVGVGVGGGVGD